MVILIKKIEVHKDLRRTSVTRAKNVGDIPDKIIFGRLVVDFTGFVGWMTPTGGGAATKNQVP